MCEKGKGLTGAVWLSCHINMSPSWTNWRWLTIILVFLLLTAVGSVKQRRRGTSEFSGAYLTLCRICRNALSFAECDKKGMYAECPQNRTTCMTSIKVKSNGSVSLTKSCQTKKKCRRLMKKRDEDCTNGYVKKQCTFCCNGYDCDTSVPKLKLERNCEDWTSWGSCDCSRGIERRTRRCIVQEIIREGDMVHLTPVRHHQGNGSLNFIPSSYVNLKSKVEKESQPCISQTCDTVNTTIPSTDLTVNKSNKTLTSVTYIVDDGAGDDTVDKLDCTKLQIRADSSDLSSQEKQWYSQNCNRVSETSGSRDNKGSSGNSIHSQKMASIGLLLMFIYSYLAGT